MRSVGNTTQRVESAGALLQLFVSPFRWAMHILHAMEPKYFEVKFSKRGLRRNEHFRLYIELEDADKTLLRTEISSELKTQFIVWHAGILDLLPSGLDDNWHKSGRVMEQEIVSSWASGIEPIIRDGKPKVWIVAGD
jgi:hypothetical protein